MKNSLKKTATELLRHQTGRGGWNVRSATIRDGKLVVTFTDQVAELAYDCSPTARTKTFDLPKQ
jgi:hypothetical protein